jgi:hypothetical protein
MLIETDAETTSASGALPDGSDMFALVDSLGGHLHDCADCDGYVAFGFNDPSYVGATLHFGQQNCPSRKVLH